MIKKLCFTLLALSLMFPVLGQTEYFKETQPVSLEIQAIKESKEFGNYQKVILLSERFLAKHLNTAACNFNTFVDILQMLKYSSMMEGTTEDYHSFKYSLLD